MADDKDKRCAHPGCNCPRSKESDYCSPSCEGAGDTAEITCNCGHSDCARGATVTAGR